MPDDSGLFTPPPTGPLPDLSAGTIPTIPPADVEPPPVPSIATAAAPAKTGNLWKDIIPAALGLIGGGFSTYGAMAQSKQYNDAIRAAQAREKELYDRYAKTTPADEMQGIMALKQQMTDQMRNAIIQQVTAGMSSRGLTASTGIVQEAIAEALVKAELPMWQMAADAYYKGRQLPIAAMPRTMPAPPGPMANPFKALVDIATNKNILQGIFGPGNPSPTDTETG